jgi:hypothetical protein
MTPQLKLKAYLVQELSALWEDFLEAMAAGDMPKVARAALGFAYFWYNFMPLARGTAAAGYVALLGVFLAAGMPITTPIPKVGSCCENMCGPLPSSAGSVPHSRHLYSRTGPKSLTDPSPELFVCKV